MASEMFRLDLKPIRTLPETTKPGWLARLSLVELVRSILSGSTLFSSTQFRRPDQNVKILKISPLVPRGVTVPRHETFPTSPSRGSPAHPAVPAGRTLPSPRVPLRPERPWATLHTPGPSGRPAAVRRPRKNQSCRLAADHSATPLVRSW